LQSIDERLGLAQPLRFHSRLQHGGLYQRMARLHGLAPDAEPVRQPVTELAAQRRAAACQQLVEQAVTLHGEGSGVLDKRAGQLGLTLEVQVEGGAARTRLARYFVDRGVWVAPLSEHLPGCLDQPLAGERALLLPQWLGFACSTHSVVYAHPVQRPVPVILLDEEHRWRGQDGGASRSASGSMTCP
jgi:hypothetical protein